MVDNEKVTAGIDLIDTLTDEELNKLVDYIRYTMKERARRRNAVAKANINVGDRVRLAGMYKPQYSIGMTGEVIEKKQTRVLVKLDSGPVGKFRSGKVLTTPSGLEVISHG